MCTVCTVYGLWCAYSFTTVSTAGQLSQCTHPPGTLPAPPIPNRAAGDRAQNNLRARSQPGSNLLPRIVFLCFALKLTCYFTCSLSQLFHSSNRTTTAPETNTKPELITGRKKFRIIRTCTRIDHVSEV